MPTIRKFTRGMNAATSPEALALWRDAFDGGGFLLAGTAEALGVPEQGEGFYAAAKHAWRRLGRAYLASQDVKVDGVPRAGSGAWALQEFGEP